MSVEYIAGQFDIGLRIMPTGYLYSTQPPLVSRQALLCGHSKSIHVQGLTPVLPAYSDTLQSVICTVVFLLYGWRAHPVLAYLV